MTTMEIIQLKADVEEARLQSLLTHLKSDKVDYYTAQSFSRDFTPDARRVIRDLQEAVQIAALQATLAGYRKGAL
jgi:hypothetical protein